MINFDHNKIVGYLVLSTRTKVDWTKYGLTEGILFKNDKTTLNCVGIVPLKNRLNRELIIKWV